MTCTRDDLLNPPQRRYKVVDLPDGRRVRIRNLTELEKSEYEASVLDAKCELSPRELRRQRLRLIVACVVDEAGHALFTEEDVPKLGQQDGAVTQRLAEECRRHCGFDAQDIENLVKNSVAIFASGSPTGSA